MIEGEGSHVLTCLSPGLVCTVFLCTLCMWVSSVWVQCLSSLPLSVSQWSLLLSCLVVLFAWSSTVTGLSSTINLSSILRSSSRYSSLLPRAAVIRRVVRTCVSVKMSLKHPDYANTVPKPALPHVTIAEHQLPTRLIVVGDVHGCLEELQDLLEKCEYRKEGSQVLLLGDLVNKGPFSAEVVQFARQEKMWCIRGNHDDAALCHALHLFPVTRPEYLSYLSKLSDDDIEWLKELPYTITIPAWRSVFVHAGLLPHLNLEDQTNTDMTTLRNVFRENESAKSEDAFPWSGTSRPDIGEPWINQWKGGVNGYHAYFGHDAKRMLQISEYATGLDTGCSYGKKLSAMILPEKLLVQVDARRVYQEITEKD